MSAIVGTAHSPRVAVFIDWQNVYKIAREAFGLWQLPNEHGNFSPFRLSRIIAAGNGRGRDGQLTEVSVYRGLPSQKHDATGYAANRRQAAAWINESPAVVKPVMRPLRYPRNYPAEPPVEKGVDVELAVAAIERTLTGSCEIAVVFSHDADLLPVPEAIARLTGADHVETASWQSASFRKRLRPKVCGTAVFHHNISRSVFDLVSTPVKFARST